MDSRIIGELVLHLVRITSGGTCAACEPSGRRRLLGDRRLCVRIRERAAASELGELCIYFVPGKPTAMKDAVTGAASR
jgi:hypothetical protein